MDSKREQNYRAMGFDLMASGEQGGDLNASCEAREEIPKCSLGLVLDSFGLSLFFLGGIKLHGAMLQNKTTFPLFRKVSMVLWSTQCDSFSFGIGFFFHTPDNVCVGFVQVIEHGSFMV